MQISVFGTRFSKKWSIDKNTEREFTPVGREGPEDNVFLKTAIYNISVTDTTEYTNRM